MDRFCPPGSGCGFSWPKSSESGSVTLLFLFVWVFSVDMDPYQVRIRNTKHWSTMFCYDPVSLIIYLCIGNRFCIKRVLFHCSLTILNPQDRYLRGGRCWKAVQQPILRQPSTMQQLQWTRQVVVFMVLPFLTITLKCRHTRMWNTGTHLQCSRNVLVVRYRFCWITDPDPNLSLVFLKILKRSRLLHKFLFNI